MAAALQASFPVAALNVMMLARMFVVLMVLHAPKGRFAYLAAVVLLEKKHVGARNAITQTQTSAAAVRVKCGDVRFLPIAVRIQACALRMVSNAVRTGAARTRTLAVRMSVVDQLRTVGMMGGVQQKLLPRPLLP